LTRITRTSRDIERFRLAFFPGREVQLVQLGQAIDQLRRRRAEALDQLGLGDAAVLHRIVHQRGHDGLRVQLPVGHQAGHCDRVGDVGLAAGAVLAQVRFVGELVGVSDRLQLAFGQVAQLGRQAGEGADLGAGRRHVGRRTRPPLQRGRQQFGGKRANTHPWNLAYVTRLPRIGAFADNAPRKAQRAP
jgi:hypothetical protein